MLESMHVRDLRKLSKYYGFTITKQIGGYKSKNDLVYDLIGGATPYEGFNRKQQLQLKLKCLEN